jgi:hypothetical protein
MTPWGLGGICPWNVTRNEVWRCFLSSWGWRLSHHSGFGLDPSFLNGTCSPQSVLHELPIRSRIEIVVIRNFFGTRQKSGTDSWLIRTDFWSKYQTYSERGRQWRWIEAGGRTPPFRPSELGIKWWVRDIGFGRGGTYCFKKKVLLPRCSFPFHLKIAPNC